MDFKSSLILALEEILDKMAFMVFEEAGKGTPAQGQFEYTSQIRFKGKLVGTLQLYFTKDTAQALARNLLGLRDDAPLYDGTIEDALGEFANILMGRTLSIFQPEVGFDLQLPQTQLGDQPIAPNGDHEVLQIEGLLDELEPCRMVVHYSK
jgi:CheY-specific phosphatase CheX